jgi:membrane protease YdiL (CAAX protease family)
MSKMSKLVQWRLFFILWLASVVANAAVIPYALALGILNTARLPLPLGVAIALQLVQSGLFFAVVIFIGFLLAQRIGFGVPFLTGWLEARAPVGLRRMLLLSTGLGALAGLLIFVMDRHLFALAIEPITAVQAAPPLWTRLLVSLYGGIAEELGMRLGLMTLIVWMTWLVKATPEKKPTNVGVWIAILIVSVIFGLGHLPMTAQLMEITPLVVTRAIILNGIGGIIFGWLYWRRGLEAAMVSHFSTDIVLHVLLPLAS